MTLVRLCWRALLLALVCTASAKAHLVVVQRGTLNIVGNGAYMVLSLPVSAFTGFDDDQDGLLSVSELRAHSADIASQVQQGVTLRDEHGLAKLEGLMFDLSPPDTMPAGPAAHLVVLGRFAIESQATGWVFALRLFGPRADEQTEHITVTRGDASQVLTLTPQNLQAALLPPAWAILIEQMLLGVRHVLSGADHLLFLLVVLTATQNLRQLVLTLTCFTAGHALTLLACVEYGLSVASAVVEPSIAATIVGMVLYDRWSQRRGKSQPMAMRLVLVFACALIHGLGLADALANLGLQGADRALAIAGFNLGIEGGQICAALPAMLVMRGIRLRSGPAGLAHTDRVVSLLALAIGAFWLLD